MEGFLRRSRQLSETPLDVTVYGEHEDSKLDDHAWLRTLRLVPGATPGEAAMLPADVRAYYVTRLFEWENQSGGPDAFFLHYGDLAPLVADGYRHLGLEGPAEAFEELLANPVTARLRDDPHFTPTDAEFDEIDSLTTAVGLHDAVRIDLIRSRPDSFST